MCCLAMWCECRQARMSSRLAGVSGAAGNTVTLVADGAVSTCGMSFSGRSYIRIIGFTMDRSLGGCANSPIVAFAGTNTGLEFWNDDVGNLNGEGYLVDHAGNGAVCNAYLARRIGPQYRQSRIGGGAASGRRR